MKKLNKKTVIILICAAVALVGLGVTAIILAKDSALLNATVVDVSSTRQEIDEYIIDWDSSAKTHEKSAPGSNIKCAITVNNITIEYEDFEEGWVAATTTYKNKGELIFTFYDDWVAQDGSFGTDKGTKGTSFINGSGGLLIKNWKNNIIIDFNGFKIDRNLNDESVSYGSVIKVDEGKNIYFKNGCITGGANTDDGGGVLIYGKPEVYFVDMTITGNFSGYNGGGIYIGSHAYAYFDNLTVEGNYAAHYGGGVYADYKSSTVNSYRIQQAFNVVKIQNNVGSDYRNNVTLCAASNTGCAQFFRVELSEGSCINVSLSRRDSTARTVVDCKIHDASNDKYFHADDPDYFLKSYMEMIGGGTLENISTTYDALEIRKK